MTALGCLFCAKKADRFVSFRRTTEALKDRAGKNLSLELLDIVNPGRIIFLPLAETLPVLIQELSWRSKLWHMFIPDAEAFGKEELQIPTFCES